MAMGFKAPRLALAFALVLVPSLGARAADGPEPSCPVAMAVRPLAIPADGSHGPAPIPAGPGDYRGQLQPTHLGWPTLKHWCVWIEPVSASGPGLLWDQRWFAAVDGALATWEQRLPISRVNTPEQAQILLWRRKPPLRHNRASHGRAELELQEVQRNGHWQIEPMVSVAISPGQAQPAIQATALHELGHAFGLWGHSDQSGDVMAVAPGAKPLLQLSPRDLATLNWLYQQPGLAPTPAAAPPAAGLTPLAPGAN